MALRAERVRRGGDGTAMRKGRGPAPTRSVAPVGAAFMALDVWVVEKRVGSLLCTPLFQAAAAWEGSVRPPKNQLCMEESRPTGFVFTVQLQQLPQCSAGEVMWVAPATGPARPCYAGLENSWRLMRAPRSRLASGRATSVAAQIPFHSTSSPDTRGWRIAANMTLVLGQTHVNAKVRRCWGCRCQFAPMVLATRYTASLCLLIPN